MGLTRVQRLSEKLIRKGEDSTLLGEAINAWGNWCEAHGFHAHTVSPETYTWVREAYVDAYLRGVQKKITGE